MTCDAPPDWDLSGLYAGPDDPAIARDLAEAARLLEGLDGSVERYAAATALLARVHAFGTLWNDGRFEAGLHGRVDAIADRAPPADAFAPEPARAEDAAVQAALMRAGAEGAAALRRATAEPPTPDGDVSWSWAEARELAVAAAASLSPEAGAAARAVFDERRVNARSAAPPLCHPAGDRGPYVRLAFRGDARSVLILAHELGHAAHQMLSRPLGVLGCDPPTAVAELAASTTEQAAAALAAAAGPAAARAAVMAQQRRNLAVAVLGTGRGPAPWSDAYGRLAGQALIARRNADPRRFATAWTALLSAGAGASADRALAGFGIRGADEAFWRGEMARATRAAAAATA